MSTRATYKFKPADNHTPETTIYIHHDGYPAGAAHYLAMALSCENTRGGLACQFIRANEGAEITGSHGAHGDTEYRYDFDEKAQTVTVSARQWDGSGEGFENVKWPRGTRYDFAEFITKHAEWDSTPREFAKLHGRYVAKAQALAWADKQLTYAMSAYFQGWTGNSSGALDDVRRHDALLNPNQRNIVNALDEKLKAAFAA